MRSVCFCCLLSYTIEVLWSSVSIEPFFSEWKEKWRVKETKEGEKHSDGEQTQLLEPFPIALIVSMMNNVLLRVVLKHGRSLSSSSASMKRSNADNRSTQLKQMLQSSQLEFIMEAHSALSAKIVEETGFKVRTIFVRRFTKDETLTNRDERSCSKGVSLLSATRFSVQYEARDR